MKNNILIVDDDTSFLLSISEGLNARSDTFNIFTAENGKEAIEILEAVPISLVVTDLKMPVMDGFELLAFIVSHYPSIPVIVMTAFGTPEIEEKIYRIGAIQYIEKPIDFKEMVDKINEAISSTSAGFITGITLPSFLQLMEMEKKTATLHIKAGEKKGTLYFDKGALIDADSGSLHGEDAAYEIVAWDGVEIKIENALRRKKRNIKLSLNHILMEGFRRKDEYERNLKERGIDKNNEALTEAKGMEEDASSNKPKNIKDKEVSDMAVSDKLKELASVEGVAGIGLFTPTGENLALLAGDIKNLKEIGVLTNNVLLNAQKASLEMGTGRGQLVHIQTESGAQIIARCLNEGNNPTASEPGKAHIHMVVVLKDDSSIGLAKMKIASVIQKLAEDFRM